MNRQTVLEELMLIVKNQLGDRAKSINYDFNVSQINLDSLDISIIIAAVEEKYDCTIRMDDFIKLKTLHDFANYILNEVKQ
ncbi:acyl carrier protein (ACP) [Desulfofarcimen acetoxidans DSM 771]|jgi:acyl carrier protein|uniref:Acyl carrier protein (ACP) n=1 Tax=Desulfofarcimen acetoxidans (strain ATCC 49208 / DSM 771 / KCTC 5769 / VKM B-1644 / 5575) TaxID=485916 RepID=C8W356_DESAS|nr:phosphopantetheine-binding protein [Desulfofarcimen acetoxidans]ACV61823.1 acyl carrier protein (ACP) [Desulfofarcimen acetoxidans DSM 771]